MKLLRTTAATIAIAAVVATTQAGDVSGPIFGDTTWDLAGSPYTLTGSIMVAAGATLTIEPGVEVRINAGLGIQIGSPEGMGPGTLVAIGTGANPIIFTSNLTSPGPGDWNSIYFTDFAVDAEYTSGSYTTGSTMQHCVVEYGGGAGGSTGAVLLVSSSPFLHGCEFRLNARAGVWADMSGAPSLVFTQNTLAENTTSTGGGGMVLLNGSSHSLKFNTFRDNTAGSYGGGLYIDDAPLVEFVDNVIEDNFSPNTGGGLYAYDATNMTFTDNTVTGNTGWAGAGAYIHGANVLAESNTFTGNATTGNHGGGLYINGTNADVLDNVITDNSGAAGGGLFVSGNDATLEANTITNNTGSSDGGGFYLSGTNAVVSENEFDGNTVTGNQQGGGAYITSGGGLQFTTNLVTNNIVLGGDGDGGGLFFNSGNSAVFGDNTITGNTAGDDGGGLYLNGASHTLSNNLVDLNGTGDAGGGVFLNAGTTTWVDNTSTGNDALIRGGGMFINQPGATLAGNPDFSNCNTISGNTAPVGPAVFNNVAFAADGSGDADASYVCWGTEDPLLIAAAIWDYFDDSTKGVVRTAPDVGGPILVDTTWTLAGSPYIVTTGVIIGNDATLTIEPGVEVRFADNMAITVGSLLYGPATLVAQGTLANPIRFVSDSPDPLPGDWKDIYFTEYAVDAVYDELGVYVEGSILEHCVIEHAGAGPDASGCVTIINSSPYLHECEITDGARAGVWANMLIAPPLEITDCTFAMNARGVVLLNGTEHVVVGCTFLDNTMNQYGAGVYVESVTGLLFEYNLLQGNVSNNTGGGFYGYNIHNAMFRYNEMYTNTGWAAGGAYLHGSNITALENVAIDNATTGNHGGGLYVTGAAAQVLGNVITDNFAAAGAGLFVSGNDAFIEGNTLMNNEGTSDGAGLYLSGTSAIVTDNEISLNMITGSQQGGGAYFTSAGGLQFYDNIVTDNDVIGATGDAGGIFHNSGNTATYTNNIITGNTAIDDGGGLYLQGSGHLLADNLVQDNFAGDLGGGAFINGTNSTWHRNTIIENEALAGGGLYNNQKGTSVAGDEMANEYNVIAYNTAITASAIYHNVPNGADGNLPAEWVCWGTTDQGVVQTMIWDFFDDSSLGLIFTFPLVDDPDCAIGPVVCVGDLNGDGIVNGADLGLLLGARRRSRPASRSVGRLPGLIGRALPRRPLSPRPHRGLFRVRTPLTTPECPSRTPNPAEAGNARVLFRV
jgi:parallel beta-helix repeat protein